jgi:hypothetical protein
MHLSHQMLKESPSRRYIVPHFMQETDATNTAIRPSLLVTTSTILESISRSWRSSRSTFDCFLRPCHCSRRRSMLSHSSPPLQWSQRAS